jgi:hypothetical protein
MAVRIDRRIAQNRRHAILESFGNKVLQTFGFVMHFIPGVFENIVQKEFQQPMMAHNFPAALLTRRRKPHSMMLLVKH